MPTFRTSDGVNLSYIEEGDGHPVVLIHGFTAPAAAWALTTDALVAGGYRVIAFDRRSHGDSQTAVFGQRMARHGRDIGELLDHLDVNDVTLVGASMGGNAIWAYVDQYGPERARAIVIVDQTPKMLNSPDWPYAVSMATTQTTPVRSSLTVCRQPAAGGTGRSQPLSSHG